MKNSKKMYEYLNQDIDCPTYLFHGSPCKLSKISPRLSHDSKGNKDNISEAVFLFPSFLKATPYAFKDTIKESSEGLDWSFDIPNTDSYPLMIMENVCFSPDMIGYIYVFKNDERFVKDENSYQYKCYQELDYDDVIEVYYRDFAEYYEVKNNKSKLR